MSILDHYISRNILSGIFLVLLILVGLFTLFTLIDEISEIGKYKYGLWQAIQYVMLSIPRQIYDLFPTALLLGSLLSLGALANNSELTVMRAAGVSILRIIGSVLRIGMVLTLAAMLIGETLAPYADEFAKDLRVDAQSASQQRYFQGRYGFWARDGQSFINIRSILSDNTFGNVSLYEFTQHRLSAIIHAKTAYYHDAQWTLQQVEKTQFSEQQVTLQHLPELTWSALLNPELVKIVILRPDKLSSLDLYRYIKYLQLNNQRTAEYELAFWRRISYPLTGATMIFLAVPFVFGSLRSVTIGQRILTGALIGISFYMMNQIIGNIGLVYEFNPLLSAFLPPLLCLSVAIALMRRAI
ncbi:MAG: LPS export ABC transporter permease LptG [Thiotrichaceae bacterium]